MQHPNRATTPARRPAKSGSAVDRDGAAPIRAAMTRFNRLLRSALLGSRWGLAPFSLGLIVALLIVLVQFIQELVHVVVGFPEMDDPTVIIAVLRLVDLVLVANLLVMIVGAGVEMFLPSAAHKEE